MTRNRTKSFMAQKYLAAVLCYVKKLLALLELISVSAEKVI